MSDDMPPTRLSLPPLPLAPLPGDIPETLGRYRLLKPLGKGGMGAVYHAFDERLQIDVAVKMPLPELLQQPGALERFRREAHAAARLHHTHLAHVFDVGEQDGFHYLVMPYIPGRPLSDRRPADLTGAVTLVRKVALGMAEAHRLGVVHRDLKPANILITPEGEPVVTDFGLALCLGQQAERLTQAGHTLGTFYYMAPEQWRGELDLQGIGCDIYSLGVILFELLTGRLPFPQGNVSQLCDKVLNEAPPSPSSLKPGLPTALERTCLRALEKGQQHRQPSMKAFADELAAWLHPDLAATGPPTPGVEPAARPLVDPGQLRLLFVGRGERASGAPAPADRLYLDVGNDLAPGVIDQHQRDAYTGSTASLVLAHPALVAGSVRPARRLEDPFTLILHAQPDLDCVASAYLASAYLSAGRFPDGAEHLARYVDRIDQGELGLSLKNPCSLYAAYMIWTNRLLARPWPSEAQHWQQRVRDGMRQVEYVRAEALKQGVPLDAVDAFACPGLLSDADRAEVLADRARYERKLSQESCQPRRTTLTLPTEFGGRASVPALLVRNVQNSDDALRCVFFKDWARSDANRAGNDHGFIALSVFVAENARDVRRCILSVKPGFAVHLRGLGALLDEAETQRRREMYHEDDRVKDPRTGVSLPPRPGYANADPWYDGQAEGWTIVDSPRGGTCLTAEEIEDCFLRFGQASAVEPLT